MMHDLSRLLKPVWGAEKWILEGWQALSSDEQREVESRTEALFSEGLPFKLKHDKQLYIFAFSLLAQLEVLAIQVPLKFESQMPNEDLKARMRQQLVDEVFHGVVFTRILYELVAPYALPPAYNPQIEVLCDFIRKEYSPKVGVVMLNLIAEGWIEELFRIFYEAEIAPSVFLTILSDEARHVSEADLYRVIGLAPKAVLQAKVSFLEEQLTQNIFFQYPYISAIAGLLGAEGFKRCANAIYEKHTRQLQKLDLVPGDAWFASKKVVDYIVQHIVREASLRQAINMSPSQKILMTQWSNPSDPTMYAEFELDISRANIFSKDTPEETLTLLMVQVLSHVFATTPSIRKYLSYQQLYQADKAYIALILKLPNCNGQLAQIVFEDPHVLTPEDLMIKIRSARKMMVYCYKRREALEAVYPELPALMDEILSDAAHGVYPYPMPGNLWISLSNEHEFGYTHAKTPLCKTEAIKLMLLTAKRKPVWDEASETFKPVDKLPISVSADHRVLDGNVYLEKIFTESFHQMYDKFQYKRPRAKRHAFDFSRAAKGIEQMIEADPVVAYKMLVMLQTMYPEFMDLEAWLLTQTKDQVSECNVKETECA